MEMSLLCCQNSKQAFSHYKLIEPVSFQILQISEMQGVGANFQNWGPSPHFS